MKTYKTLQDFSSEQTQKFEAMHRALRAYNADLRAAVTTVPPAYTDEEMAEYSIYRQLLLAAECEE